MRKLILTFIVILFLELVIHAQVKLVTGTVHTAIDGSALAGVSVVVKGTSLGTITNQQGYFELKVPEQVQSLVFSFIGMKTLEAPVEGTLVNVLLEPDVVGLDEVVVVAYDASLKKHFTGSVSTVSSTELDRFQASGFTEVLQGLSAGVYTAGENGQPGEAVDIRIRGFNTFGNASPLIVLDRFPFDGNLNAIPLTDIESLTVLKDAQATALYGSRAANGVIIITTKKGIPGTSGLNLRINYGLSGRAIPDYRKVSASQYYELYWEGIRNSLMESGFSQAEAEAGASGQLVPLLGGYNAYDVDDQELVGSDGRLNSNATRLWNDNWYDELFETGKRRELSLTASGGSENSTYFLSGSLLDEVGIIRASNLKRYAVRANINSRLSNFINTGVQLSGSLSEQNNPESAGASMLNPFRFAGLIAPVYPVYLYDENGQLQTNAEGERLFDYGSGYGRTRPYASNLNVLGTLELDERLYKNDVFSFRSFLDFNLAKGLTFQSSIGADYEAASRIIHQNMRYGDGQNFNGRTTRQNFRTLSYTANQMICYNWESGLHGLYVFAAHENYNYKINSLVATRSGFPFPGLVELDGAAIGEGSGSFEDNYRLESYFGKLDYSFRNRYFASFNFRTDGNSRFAKDVRWGNFWGAGIAWLITGEDFLENNTFLDLIKLKASYGEQGNDKIGSYYGYQGLYQTGMNNLDYPGLIASRLATPNLTWETLKSLNFGTELVLNERFSMNLEYYIRHNDRLLFEKPLPPSTGFVSVDDNIARLSNSGFDLEVKGLLVNARYFKWVMDLNLGHFKNEIKELPQEFIISGNKRWEKGKSIYHFWIEEFAGVNPETGKSQWYYNVPEIDSNGNPMLDDEGNPVFAAEKGITDSYALADRYYTGSAIPDLFGGLNNSFSVFDFDLSLLFTFGLGGKIYDNTYMMLMHSGLPGYNFHADVLNRWTPDNRNSNIPVIDGDQFANRRSSRFLVDADYLNIRNISLGYQIPEAAYLRLNLESIRLVLKADNLVMITAREGLVTRQSFEGNADPKYVPVRTVSVGLDVKF